jgi:hypothetical protein
MDVPPLDARASREWKAARQRSEPETGSPDRRPALALVRGLAVPVLQVKIARKQVNVARAAPA